SPTAEPRIPASASGVSTQRSGPKRSRSPAVARKTPPARPTSSPITITFSSRPSSTWKPSLIASTRVSSAKGPLQLGEVGLERGGRIDVRVREDERRVGRRLGLGGGDPVAHQLRRLRANGFGGLVRQQPRPAQVGLVAADALAAAFLLDPLEVDVRRRVVRGRV